MSSVEFGVSKKVSKTGGSSFASPGVVASKVPSAEPDA